MLECMMQGVARAGGVEMVPGTTILAPKARRVGVVRRLGSRVLTTLAVALQGAANRLAGEAREAGLGGAQRTPPAGCA